MGTYASWLLIVWLLDGSVRVSEQPTIEACVRQSHVEMHDPAVRNASCRPDARTRA